MYIFSLATITHYFFRDFFHVSVLTDHHHFHLLSHTQVIALFMEIYTLIFILLELFNFCHFVDVPWGYENTFRNKCSLYSGQRYICLLVWGT